MFNLNSSPVLHNCRFVENITFTGELLSAGGAMFNINSNPTLVNCLFSGNVATGFDSDYIGGGMCNYGSSPSLVDCSFVANLAYWGGGGMFNDHNSSPALTACTFQDNWGHYCGGAMFNERSTLILTNCAFQQNAANIRGGGIHNDRDCRSTITNCTFSANAAGGRGGGMYNYYGSSTIVSNCEFVENRAGEGGGIYNAGGAGVTLTNCMLTGNTAGFGGGIYNYHGSDTTLANSTLSRNSAGDKGGGIYSYHCSPVLNNCILWGDTPGEIHVESNTPVITYSDVQGGWPGQGNIDADPLFADPNNADYHLLPDSPCIDAGDNNSVPADVADLDADGNTTEPIPFDLDGNPRMVDGNHDGNSVVDMGAYEFFMSPLEVWMKFTPQAVNPGSEGNWMKAHFVLPEGYAVEDVDANAPAVVEPGGIESDYMNVFLNDDGLVEIEAAFDRADFCSIVTGAEPMEVRVTGSLTTGQQFYGTDTIRITTNYLKYLGTLASRWLEAGCGKPDWCSGLDLDQNSAVDFVDYALFDGCCIEVIRQ
jgi:predicted outer membrane repeat protein